MDNTDTRIEQLEKDSLTNISIIHNLVEIVKKQEEVIIKMRKELDELIWKIFSCTE